MHGVENALGRLDGVRHVEVQQGTLRVYITPASDRTLDLAAISPAVRTGGARVVRMRIAARGRVERGAGGASFRIDGWPRGYPIEGDDTPEGPCTIRATVHIDGGTPQLSFLERRDGKEP